MCHRVPREEADDVSQVDSHIYNLGIEAAWAAKFAGLSRKDAVNLVSKNIEDILKLDAEERDFVIWEGDPLEFGASVVLSFENIGGFRRVETCWPEAT